MTDRIRVSRLSYFAHHGVFGEEARIGQRFHVSLDAEVDTRAAGRSDDVADTVSYADMTAIALDVGTSGRFQLIEALAEATATAILRSLPKVRSIVVEVEKPSAPVPAVIESVSVRIERSRDDL